RMRGVCRERGRSESLQIGGGVLAAAAVGFDVEADLLAFIQGRHAGALDRRNVNEHIRSASVLHDKAETLLGVEKLDSPLSHNGLHLKRTRRFVSARTIRAGLNPDLAFAWNRPM